MTRTIEPQKINRRSPAEDEFEDRIELLRSRVECLTGTNRVLMEMYLDKNGTFRQIARLMGVNEASISRRIHKLIRRLLDGQYITCLRNREKFTKKQIKIAKDYFVSGLPMSKIAERHRISCYAVRQTMKRIQRIVDLRTTAAGGLSDAKV